MSISNLTAYPGQIVDLGYAYTNGLRVDFRDAYNNLTSPSALMRLDKLVISTGTASTNVTCNVVCYEDNGPTPSPTMTRLKSFNDWTIALEAKPTPVQQGTLPYVLVAFNSTGKLVRSAECKLVLDGVAFAYKDSKLFSGALTHDPSEQEVEAEAKAARNAKVQKQIDKLNTLRKNLDVQAMKLSHQIQR